MKYTKLIVKSRDEIENTLSGIEYNIGGIDALYNKKKISLSKYIWDICSTKIDTAIGQELRTHEFDYAYLYDGVFKKDNTLPFIYLMKEWVEVYVPPPMVIDKTLKITYRP